MLAPKAPDPFTEVPTPRITCISCRKLWNAGILTQKTCCDSPSFSATPFKVTLILLPSLPLILNDEYPSPLPPSVEETTDGIVDRSIGIDCTAELFCRFSFVSDECVTGVFFPARKASTTTLSNLSYFSFFVWELSSSKGEMVKMNKTPQNKNLRFIKNLLVAGGYVERLAFPTQVLS
ncbi:hypothetical protein SDC9_91875 [bioreactor metagenome]|uniref:Uncharacterized protein n=1 Tax=bioreactor metagenome TaxID=1076179 RepID=A0A644ZW29_9ZZZZ